MALSSKWQEMFRSLWKLYRAIWRWYHGVYNFRVRGRANMRALSPAGSPTGETAIILTPLSLARSPLSPPSGLWGPLTSSNSVDFSLRIIEGKMMSENLRIAGFHLLNRHRTSISIPLINGGDSGPIIAYVASQIMHPIICVMNCLRSQQNYAKIHYKVAPLGDAAAPNIVQVQIAIGEHSEHLAADYAKSSLKMPLILFYPPNSLERFTASIPKCAQYNGNCIVRFPKSLRYQLEETTPLVITDFTRVFMAAKVDTFAQTADGELVPRPHLAPPTNPPVPQPSDDEILATRHEHADFDRYVLAFTPSAIPQFLRWKREMQSREIPRMEGDILAADLWTFSCTRSPFDPRYPLEQLPEVTEKHLIATERPTYPQFVELLKCSSHCLISLDDELTPPDGTGYARTFTCRIIQVEGKDITVEAPPRLCVKIYDDSAGQVMPFSPSQSGTAWMREFYTAQDMLQNEENVYYRLRHAWGSIIPFYYGIHRFACKDGRYRYGLLMELVPKTTKPLREHSRPSQISFIQSARHAVRVLQYADITQYDWSGNMAQMVVTPSPGTLDDGEQALSCTLVDFALAKQSDVFFDVEKEDDYAHMASAIIINVDGNEDGVEAQLMREYYGPREEWDFLRTDLDF
ncbi:hypothetical protein NM688_g693 [Phlebia brevispora]|uniref:Uncharacterized protein n=1 Tax=Phlebia brevispora TaxID=194682 RepID=A0ACC1TDV5_9APHY|nr:hypothetical protein NM688_g693 [Phlebia brevispora]